MAAGFAGAGGLRVLEIGCGLGADGAQFAQAGADYTGVDLTEAAVELARKRFELFNLPWHFSHCGRRGPGFRRRFIRSGLLARRLASHTKHVRRDSRDPPRPETRRSVGGYALPPRLV